MKTNSTNRPLTKAEQRIMNVLWEKGEATVREITENMSKVKPLAYNSVLTITRVLQEKAFVGFRKEGRKHIYFPLVTKNAARKTAIQLLVGNLFDGSPKLLAQHLLEQDDFSKDEVESLQNLLNELKAKDSKP
jgi:predicted transcriptional regulator